VKKRFYSFHFSGEDADFLGCVTDHLPDNRLITVPMYAKFCSAICYIKDVEKRKEVHHCPHNGHKHEKVDPNLQRLF